MRRIGSARGRYNVPNVAIFAWRDHLFTRTDTSAAAVDSTRFRFHELGIDQQLAIVPVTELTSRDRVTALNLPARLTRRAMSAAPGDYYGLGKSIAVSGAGQPGPIALADIVVCDLADSAADGSTWSNVARLVTGQVALDPQLGRLAFGDPQLQAPRVSFATTATSDIGGAKFHDAPGPWTVTVAEGGVFAITGLLVAGGPLVVKGRPNSVVIDSCTLVPGRRPDSDGDLTAPVGPSLVLDLDTDWQAEVLITRSIVGSLCVPAGGTTLSIADSIVDGVDNGLGRSFASGAGARVTPVLRSPAPLGPLALPAGSTTLRLTLGTDPSMLVDLGSVPADVTAAAALLQAALSGSGARALLAGQQLIVVGDGRPLAITAAPGSDLAQALGLTGAAARTRAVVGAPADAVAAAAGGEVTVTDRFGVDRTVTVAAGTADLPSLADRLQAAVRAADPEFGSVLVGELDGALVLAPGGGDTVTVTGSRTDLETAWSLGLVSPRPAIAADPSGAPGAALSLERCTVFGDVEVGEVGTIADSIITGVITSERLQTGCIQYSWISPGSRTPRQHDCQPATAQTPPPTFASRRYATAGYARLRRTGATALIRGASDGFEMGAMARLRQTQRDDNLRRGIEEFLRVGLEAGVIDGD